MIGWDVDDDDDDDVEADDDSASLLLCFYNIHLISSTAVFSSACRRHSAAKTTMRVFSSLLCDIHLICAYLRFLSMLPQDGYAADSTCDSGSLHHVDEV